MNVPSIRVSDDAAAVLASRPQAALRVARHLAPTLSAYPHFCVLRGMKPVESRGPIDNVARAVAHLEPRKPGVTNGGHVKVSFTQVRINEAVGARRSAVTNYSRTNQPLELHTDSSYRPEPDELIAFQMIRPDERGGETLMAAVEDIVAALDEDVIARLRQPNFPFGRGDQPVLWENGGQPNIRYYRSQLDVALAQGADLAPGDRAAIDALDRALERPDKLFRFHLEAGETLFIHNTKALHGRTGFEADSPRLMFRYRIPVGCLG